MAKYDEMDKAAVFVALRSNDGNIAATSRDTGIPEQTVRDWRKQFEVNPPDLSLLEQVTNDFLTKAETVRDLLLEKYHEAVKANKIGPEKMPVHIGILTDKITLVKGITRQKAESTALGQDQVKVLAAGLVQAVRDSLSMQSERENDIIEVEAEEIIPRELPSKTGV